MGSGYDAVLLDAGGVLLLPDPDAIRAALAPFGVEPDDETCRRCHYVWIREFDRLSGERQAVMEEVTAAALGVEESDIERASVLLGSLFSKESISVPAPGIVQALQRLKQTGVALCIVSNADGTLERRLEDFGLCSVDGGDCVQVAIVVDSGVVGIEKPDPRIFDIAVDALGVEPERTLYVGDTVCKDVVGARAAGLHPLHLDPYGLCTDGSHSHVESLAAVADLLA